jgi:mono/diheme cytochrome c family protein
MNPASGQSAVPAAGDVRSVLDGVYTAAQAKRGGEIFATRCGVCHSPAEFRAPTFLRAWRGQPVHALYAHIRDLMPFDNPGSLAPQEYTDVVSYILELNSFPAGDDELPADPDAQKRIRIEIAGSGEQR